MAAVVVLVVVPVVDPYLPSHQEVESAPMPSNMYYSYYSSLSIST